MLLQSWFVVSIKPVFKQSRMLIRPEVATSKCQTGSTSEVETCIRAQLRLGLHIFESYTVELELIASVREVGCLVLFADVVGFVGKSKAIRLEVRKAIRK